MRSRDPIWQRTKIFFFLREQESQPPSRGADVDCQQHEAFVFDSEMIFTGGELTDLALGALEEHAFNVSSQGSIKVCSKPLHYVYESCQIWFVKPGRSCHFSKRFILLPKEVATKYYETDINVVSDVVCIS